MLTLSLFTLGSVLLVSAISMVGIAFFLTSDSVLQRSLLYFVSFSTGGLLGDVFIHMIPEIEKHKETFLESLYVLLGGIVCSFIVEKIIKWRHCHTLPSQDHAHYECHSFGLMSMVGDGVHNFIDGVVIAASYLASIPVGITTTLAVLAHEIPHEIGNFAVLLHSGVSRKKAVLWNVLSASTAFLGALCVLFMSDLFQGVAAYMLPFAAGNLLYIAGADLIPELHKETDFKHSFWQLLALLLGMGIMLLLRVIGE